MAAYHIRYKTTPDVEPPTGRRRRMHRVQEVITFVLSALVMYGVYLFVRKLWH